MRPSGSLLGLVRTAMERMGHQLRFHPSVHAGPKPASRLARLDRAAHDDVFGYATRGHQPDGTLAIPTGLQTDVGSRDPGDSRYAFCLRRFTAARSAPPPARPMAVASGSRILRHDPAPGDASIQRDAEVAGATRAPQASGANAIRICNFVPGEDPVGSRADELTEIYQAARFGGQATDPRQASSLLSNIQSALRST